MSRCRRGRHITSKWRKTRVLWMKRALRSNIPETRRMTRDSLKSMLHRYRMVYIKPDVGTYGNGVMRVEIRGNGTYSYQSGLRARQFASFNQMFDSIRKLTRRRRYLVQKGIHLTKYRKRRFDIRVMVQQSPSRRWEATGVIGRVGDPRKVVTNVHNGGKITPIEKLLAAYMPERKKRIFVSRLKRLGMMAAKQLHSRFRGIKEIGLDVALDQRLHPWVLEANTCPDPYIFNKLKDKRIFGRIARYARAYGRL
ncbi:YheC/YheD family protein [Paenibacillus sp. TAB 01]|uniref:YheC/YheD family protein n=1 Tax=Paenibacillus sp. TAB 01 TaxID=3368988 RepID=UPI0037538510